MTIAAVSAYGSALLLLVTACLFLLLYLRSKNIISLLVVLSVMCLAYVYFLSVVPERIEEGEAEFVITWSDSVKIDGGTVKGFAKTASGEMIYATYRLNSPAEKEQFLTIDFPNLQIQVTGHFQPIQKPAHLYAFQMENYLKMYGANGVFQIEKITGMKEKHTFYSRLLSQRKRVKAHIQETFPVELVAEAEALLIGDRSGMDEEMSAAYRTLGITHLFAISGLHVGLLTFLLRECLLRLMIRKETVDVCLILFLPDRKSVV